MDCGRGGRGDNGLLYVCLMAWLDKESSPEPPQPHPSPHSLEALENVSNIKRGTLTFLVMLWEEGHELGE